MHLDVEVETSYPITFTITRDADDPQRQPCIIHRDPIEDGVGQPGIMLFQCTSEISHYLHPVSVDPDQLRAKSLQPQEVSTLDPCFKELVPGASVSWEVPLPDVYFDSFRPGQFYNILWVGGQIPLWDWGTLAEHSNGKLSPKSPALILPGGLVKSLGIIAEESDIDEEAPLPPSPKPRLASARVSGAPILSLSLAGPPTLSFKDRTSAGRLRYTITGTLSYNIDSDAMNGEPVTFHTFRFREVDRRVWGFRLYYGENNQWCPYEPSDPYRYREYRYSNPVANIVGRNDQNAFAALRPGESWSFTREVTEFPENAAPGDQFRYGFKGAQLDWWDWGHLRDHEDTVVWIEEIVCNPRYNGGRPVLIVPASNWVEFALVE
ncbi:uncharacterized protein N7482_008276 [Penicillium canariense]|uniref:Uncharacterized protein n=1 Tax=Penicillium canariense TaxID=189055 RepID=A0A9W9HWA3_9EURO|nr:uncharacterized protein N7482_008276 [Penicillium canariense]KAJ5157176.1 hypothetical protein N7482_008276 [Penicillium canariense]